ncbi:octanoyltransferase [Fluviibacter phosphoraccumulans]|uniref:Octanoyltransferase n=1 Tax=Fluviibacter phosphoraccumulans TaxID=1751046 RepID=A0A679I031_9RHOO|nr:octanoyltransferase [Fluviibacter phosphoraccumulans]BBU70127.1 octanoyltransferase [Fluviibacter phosphoraccumulans]BCA66517.1 octanoyltransferase [Fluviibacter phosphoraccumulans]
MTLPLHVRRLGLVPYEPTWHAMRDQTLARVGDAATDAPDELWLVEHAPVFTQGQAGKPEHLLQDIGVPVVPIDRGGQITYHGPGQVVIYLLIDLSRRGIKVRELVNKIEQAVIDCLAAYGITADRREGAPGVYVGEAKVAALGLRIRNGCSYHGVSLNVDMDMTPFSAINPCGYAGMAVTQLHDLGVNVSVSDAGEDLLRHLQNQLESSDG